MDPSLGKYKNDLKNSKF